MRSLRASPRDRHPASGESAAPGAVLRALNEGLMGHTGSGYVTCCCARFDRDGRELELAPGLPPGIVADAEYPETAARGESFTLISGGAVEAENSQRELFRFDRTREISTKSAQEIAEPAKAWGQNDDITVVTVRRSL